MVKKIKLGLNKKIKKSIMSNFNKYSEYYDLLYGDKDYDAESEYIYNHLSFNQAPKSLLELGCGSGSHAEYFSKKNIVVSGIDMSTSMIKIANEKKINNFNPIVGDITSFSFNKKFDSIISLFHVISYLNDDKSLLKCFQLAYDHLNLNGYFIFDFWYTPNLKFEKPEIRIKRKENNEMSIVRIAEPEILSTKNIVKVNFDIFILDKSTKEISNLKEVHPMRHFQIEELKNIAKSVGFDFVLAEEFLTAKVPSNNSNGVLIKFIKK